MKLNKILTGLFLFISTLTMSQSQSQDSTIQHYNKYPQEAIQDADKMFQQGIREHNSPLLIKALILKTTFMIKIDHAKYQQCIQEVEDYIIKEKDPNTQSILHSYVGQLYSIYYHNNQYKINRRTNLKGKAPANMSAWSKNLFMEKIYQHLWASIAPKQSLQKTPVSNYNLILTQEGLPNNLRPTLYDFLCHRAISILKENSDLSSSPKITSSPLLLANTADFLKMPIPLKSLNGPSHILKIWQDLLAFHQQAGNTNALLMADLERIDYTFQISTNKQKDSLYLSRLEEMEKQYHSNPMVIEIMSKEAKYLLNNYSTITPFAKNSSPKEILKRNKEQALAICEQGIQLYPHYSRIGILKNLIEIIKAPTINIEFPKTIYPGDSLSVKINSQNLTSVSIYLYRIGMNNLKYESLKNQKGRNIPKKLVYQHVYPLTNSLVPEDTTLQLPSQDAGFFEIVIKIKEAKQNIVKQFVCTQLFTTYQIVDNQIRFWVCDWQSGTPVDHAKVLILSQNTNHSTRIDSIYTNKQGLANLKSSKAFQSYEVVNPANPCGNILSIYGTYHSDNSQQRTTIITDRKLYRPGQTVYFKGVAWQETTNQLHSLNNQTYEIIFRDPNRKEISKQKVISNSYGSFSGKFEIPQQTLNGNYTLSTNYYTTNIQVADYKRPEFEVSFSQPEQTYYAGDTVHVKGKVSSFSGVNISHATVKYDISASSYYYWIPNNQQTQGVTHTNDRGEFELTFKAKPIETSNIKRPYFYMIKATVTDSKGETEEGATNIPIYAGNPTPVIVIPQTVNKDKETVFRISLQDLPSPQETRTVTYTLSKLVTPLQPDQLIDTIIEKTVLEGQLQIQGQDSLIPSLQNFTSGAYLFTAKCDHIKTDYIFYLYSTADKRPPIPTYNWLIEEKTNCKPGDTARIQFGTSVRDAYVMYQIFSADKLIKQKMLLLSDEIVNIDIPYLPDYGNQIWLSINYIKNKQYINNIIPIQRINENLNLNIQTTVFRDKLLPGQQEQWEIKILSDKNQPVIAEVLAMMYDASLDQLYPYHPNLRPNYLYQSFPYYWKQPYAMNGLNYDQLFSSSFRNKIQKVPLFKFPELYLYAITPLAPPALSPRITDMMELAEAEVYSIHATSNRMAKTKTLGFTSADQADAGTGNIPEIDIRKNFQETAFFYPQLQTDSSGNVNIRFTMPESLTKWKFIALANTPSMAVGKLERYITTSKPLMIRPNFPRFLRSGDHNDLKAVISNLTDSVQQGISTMEFFVPTTGQVLYRENQNFNIQAGQNQTVNFSYIVPEDIELIGYRITASGNRFSDGEQNLLPILPNETLITETLPIYTTSEGEHSYTIKPSSQGRNYRLTLEFTANPIWYAVLALPGLTEPAQENVTAITASYYVNTIASAIAHSNPQIIEAIRNWNTNKNQSELLSKLSQNPELKSILLSASPWAIQAQTESEQIQSLIQLFDPNRLNYLQNQAIDKLSSLQTENGGWSWFKGMYSSRFMTLNVLKAMSQVNIIGQHEAEVKEKDMQIKALRYLDHSIITDFKKTPKRIQYDQLLYLYIRSLYRDIPLAEALDAHKYFISLAQKQWGSFSFYEKAITAIAMKNYGFSTEAKQIIASLRQYSVITSEAGMYWPNNTNDFYRNSAIQVHTAIMEAFQSISDNKTDIDLMKQWLLRQKQVQNWGNAPATIDAIHALLLTGNNLLNKAEQVKIKLGPHEFSTSNNTNPLGYIRQSYLSGNIKPNMLTVKINKQSATPSWGGLYLQYFEALDQVKNQKTELSVEKQLFVTQTEKNGKSLLIPLEQHSLKTGDQVIVRLTLSLKRDMEFLHLKDLRAACFEPIEQLSGNQWKFGTVYYEDVKDASTNFFFHALSRGTYVIEYPLWVSQSGIYQDGIATFQSIYAPDYNSFSNASKIEVKN